MEVNIGINEQDRKKIAQSLSKVLAESYLLYIKNSCLPLECKRPFI